MKHLFYISSILLMSIAIVACGGEDDKNGDDSSNKAGSQRFTVVPDLSTGTSSAPLFAYYDLDTEQVLTLTESEAEENTEWDIAFKRTEVYLNQNAITPVSLYFTDNTDEFYDSTGSPDVTRFINATAETEEAAFNNADITIPGDEEFHADESSDAMVDWYNYSGPPTHTVTADTETFFIVESGNNYAKFNVTDLVQDGFDMTSITLSRSVQLQGESAFGVAATETFVSSGCTENVYIDLVSLTQVTSADAWDLSVPCEDGAMSFDLDIGDDNRAINDPTYTEEDSVDVAALRYLPWLDNVEVTHAIVVHGDENSNYGWGEYGVNGGHGLWPNFAIYVIQTPSAYYKFQITNYYHSETEASGNYTFRFEELSE